jgi:hypothetical protein
MKHTALSSVETVVTRIIPDTDLQDADLIVDAIYEGDPSGSISSEPISRLLGGGNQGGFRKVGSPAKLAVLYSSLEDRDWPDGLDGATGLFVYYGDNKRPGHDLHDTPRRGNELLRAVFADIRASPLLRADVPPFVVFTKHPTTRSKRSVQFRGLAVPGARSINGNADLVAIWKSTAGQRFQNYRTVFTVLDALTVAVSELANGPPTLEMHLAPYHRARAEGVVNQKYTSAGEYLAWHRAQVFQEPATTNHLNQ